MTRCAIYTRVSSDDQVKGNSLAQQERACTADAEQRGWEVVATFVDDGVSSKVRPDDRPAFAALLSADVEVLLAQDLDRVVRDSGHLEDLLRDHRDLRIVTRDGVDTGSGSNLMTRIKAAVAHEEREKIRLRSTRNRLDRARQGHWVCGKPPLGYRQVDERIVHDDSEVEMVEAMAELYLASHNARAVAEQINARGYVTRAGNEWTADGIRRVLRNEALLGTFTWQFPGARILGEAFDQQTFTYEAEPVLDHETFSRIVPVLARSNRGRYSGREMYPLSGLVFCEHGRHYTGARWSKRTANGHTREGTGRMYRIDAQQEPCDCVPKTIGAPRVEGAVMTWITMRLLQRETLEAILEEHRSRQKDALEAQKTVAQLRKREAALRLKQEDVFLRFDGEAADRILTRVAKELATVSSQIASLEQQVGSVEITADDLEAAIVSVTGDLRDPQDLQRVARALDVRVTVTPTGRRKGRMKVTGTIPVATKSRTHGA